MKRILIHISAILLLALAGFHPLYAQSDSIKKQIPSNVKVTDSEKKTDPF